MGVTGIDLFSGAGGFSTGAVRNGVDVLWAANHSNVAVEYHRLNHPSTQHVVQDLHQAKWELVPSFDLGLASPCCQNHSPAKGTREQSVKADASRSTAWAVVACAEYHQPPLFLVENVPYFMKWKLYPAWVYAMNSLGYSVSVNIINAKDLGVPQSRKRLFLACTKSKHPIKLELPQCDHVPASSFINMNHDRFKWDLVSSRVIATQKRVENGRRDHGEIFIDTAYGTSRTGFSIHKPIGTIMTSNKHSVVYRDLIRPLSVEEQALAQSFDEDYIWPESKVDAKRLIGNSVPPLMAEKVISAFLQAA